MLSLSQNQIGKGWIEVPNGTPIQTLDQYLSLSEGKWKISSIFTSQKINKPDAVVYRRPVTLIAQTYASLMIFGKILRFKIIPFFIRITNE